jgi:hypothetical protein
MFTFSKFLKLLQFQQLTLLICVYGFGFTGIKLMQVKIFLSWLFVMMVALGGAVAIFCWPKESLITLLLLNACNVLIICKNLKRADIKMTIE